MGDACPRRCIERLARRYRAGLSSMHPAADRITDKRPDNFLYIGLIKQLFPDASIVHTTRRCSTTVSR